MAKYVLVEFSDDTLADACVADWQREAAEGDDTIVVRGVYKKPTQFCACELPVQDKNRTRYETGMRFGWRVCPVCRKPRRTTVQNPTNLFDDSRGAGIRRFDEHTIFGLQIFPAGKARNEDGTIPDWG